MRRLSSSILCFILLHTYLTDTNLLYGTTVLSDSEGRFVIGDGCSWLARRHGCRILIDAATLTGHSQFTGRVHGAILSNDMALEMVGLASGSATGELVHPMIFAPEQAKDLLHSTVADMTNDPVDGDGCMYSAMSGYFVYAQVEDVPDVRWAFCCSLFSYAGSSEQPCGLVVFDGIFGGSVGSVVAYRLWRSRDALLWADLDVIEWVWCAIDCFGCTKSCASKRYRRWLGSGGITRSRDSRKTRSPLAL
eukprot:COSAG02_NODE_2949_length_7680_cov_4.274238_3_plen_249_part_00